MTKELPPEQDDPDETLTNILAEMQKRNDKAKAKAAKRRDCQGKR